MESIEIFSMDICSLGYRYSNHSERERERERERGGEKV